MGYYAVESLRIEKGFRAWGRELTPDVNPYEAGLGFAVKLDKGDFIGRDALVAARAGRAKRLVSIFGPLPETQMAWGGESSRRRRAGRRDTSAAFGATLGGIVGLAWVHTDGEAIDRPGSIGDGSSSTSAARACRSAPACVPSTILAASACGLWPRDGASHRRSRMM